MTGDTTDTSDEIPWEGTDAGPGPEAVHLVIGWALDEPDRAGEVARIDSPLILGRGPVNEDERSTRLVFYRERSSGSRPTRPLGGRRISREQLKLRPVGGRRIEVENTGRCKLYVNGIQTDRAVVEAGDVLRLHWALVLAVESRPTSFARLNHYPADRHFEFGTADADGIVGESHAAWRLRDSLAFAARSREHVLLLGPTGSGKELAARAIHSLSPRARKGFVARNAATLPESIVDAELFGTAKDYPNAGSPFRPGIVAEADGGTLFLDEIGELPDRLQAHLLRVLDHNGEYQRLGDARMLRSDLRLVAATNRELTELKRDFAARLKLRVRISGLSERREDIPLLIPFLLGCHAETNAELRERFFDRHAGRWVPRLSPELVEALLRHHYTEHTRELERALLAALSSSTDNFLALTPEVADTLKGSPDEAPPDLSADALESALARAKGNVTEAARHLGLKNRYVLYRLMKKHGLSRADEG